MSPDAVSAVNVTGSVAGQAVVGRFHPRLPSHVHAVLHVLSCQSVKSEPSQIDNREFSPAGQKPKRTVVGHVDFDQLC